MAEKKNNKNNEAKAKERFVATGMGITITPSKKNKKK